MSRLILLSLLFAGWSVQAAESEKLVIAHRGASGYLPEHTLAAKALAFGQGAHYLEQDVVMTRDDHLIVFHDLTLDRTTNVAQLYPGRARADGAHYVIDFTLTELRALQVSEGQQAFAGIKVPLYPGRFPPGGARFSIHTLQEELELIAGLRHSTGRSVGIYPELKAPWFHHQHGKDLATAVLEVLKQYGYTSKDEAVFLQSFDHRELVRVHDELLPALGMDLKLVQLIAENAWGETWEPDAEGNLQPYDYAWMHTPAGLHALARSVDGIGPALDMLVDAASPSHMPVISSITRDAHAAGLLVHPYTFRRDRLPAYVADFDELLELVLFEVGVDGIFTDFPDLAVGFLQSRQ